jgi:hypothetical protein
VEKIRKEDRKTFLIQSKDPKTFARVIWPTNVILGTTIETNRDDIYAGMAPNAPLPSQRYRDFLKIKHPQKMVTIEPVMDFDLDTMIDWMGKLKPCLIWLGYDSKKNHLPEPELAKVKELYWALGKLGFTINIKTVPEEGARK